MRIFRLTSRTAFEPFRDGIGNLLAHYADILCDDHAATDVETLVENTATTMPSLWIVVSDRHGVVALACLTDVMPGRHAYVHGVSHPAIRRHPVIRAVALAMMESAFKEYQLLKLKAEFETRNRSAKGFCWRMGFRREARFKNDIRIGGRLHDVDIYSLPAARLHTLKPQLM